MEKENRSYSTIEEGLTIDKLSQDFPLRLIPSWIIFQKSYIQVPLYYFHAKLIIIEFELILTYDYLPYFVNITQCLLTSHRH